MSSLRPSPAMGVALVALVFSSTGVATGQLPNPLPLQNTKAPETIVRTAADYTESYSDARCAAGERAVGGGGSHDGFLNRAGFIEASLPTRGGVPAPSANPDGWRVYVRRPDGGPAFVQAWVVCVKPS